jgi:SAM-dependent methyltransferase
MNLLVRLLLCSTTASSVGAFSASVDGSVPSARSNPLVDPDTRSPSSGVRYSQVLDGLHALYPPAELEARTALSRKDGYWPYITAGEEPPMSNTYGEFDFFFFAQLLDRAHGLWKTHNGETMTDWSDKVFVDIGSGTGRLVAAAAALHPSWKTCRGIELLPTIHESAVASLGQCGAPPSLATTSSQPLPMAPIELVCGSFDDPHANLGDADLIFMFSSCLNPALLTQLAHTIGRDCRPGTLIITTDYKLDLAGSVPSSTDGSIMTNFQLEQVDEVNGWCWCTGGTSTAHIHRVTQSARGSA